MNRHRSPNNNLKLTKSIAALVVAAVLFFEMACTVSSESLEFKRAEQDVQKNRQEDALKHFQAIVDRYVKTPLAIESAKEAARINHYQLKRPKDAVPYYRHVILYSQKNEDRIQAQKKLANLYFTETLDYTQAITEFSRLLELPHTPVEDYSYRLSIARSYFYLSNFYQSQVEIDSILSRGFDKDMVFDALLLKANIFLTSKKLDEAIATLKQLMEKYPERSKTETIGLVLAVTYEEKKDFTKAIETLQSIKDAYPKKSFIEQRIKTLRERQSFLPGARGLKK